GILGILRHLLDLRPAFTHLLDDVGDMTRLLVHHMREIRAPGALNGAQYEEVREAVAMNPMKGPRPFPPLLGERPAAAAVDRHRETGEGREIETRRIDDAVDPVFLPSHDEGILGDPIDALAGRIHELDVRA